MQHEITKMLALGFNYSVVGLIFSSLSNRHQCMRSSEVRSQYKLLEIGASLGTKLRLLLWLIYMYMIYQ